MSVATSSTVKSPSKKSSRHLQHSSSSATLPNLRPSRNSLSLPRPNSEFGWQLNLQHKPKLSEPVADELGRQVQANGLKEDAIPEEGELSQVPPALPPKEPLSPTKDGKDPSLHVPSPLQSPDGSLIASDGATVEKIENPNGLNEDEANELSKRYAKKDIGWQLALQNLQVPPVLQPLEQPNTPPAPEDPAPTVLPPIEKDTAPEPSPTTPTKNDYKETNPFAALIKSAVDNPFPLLTPNLEEAFPSFSTNPESSALHLQHYSNNRSGGTTNPFDLPPASPLPTYAPPREHRYSGNLIDFDTLPPPIPIQEVAEPEPLPRREPVRDSAPIVTLVCAQCSRSTKVEDINQPQGCDDMICGDCLLDTVRDAMKKARFPVYCPVCPDFLNPGTITQELVEKCDAIPVDLVNRFQQYQLAAHSTQLFCPKCQETMLVDREQYLEESVITCPLRACRHRWCKLCLKEMPAGDRKHKCKPDKKNGVCPCPGCGTPGRKIGKNNHIKCRGLLCQVHFCFKCGATIADESNTPDTTDAIIAHYRNCAQYGKSSDCTIM